ncbi:hypothetical protein BDV06DRAFT_221857 [Aspergillus oleicola]
MGILSRTRTPTSPPKIKTRFRIISDTRGHQLPPEYLSQKANIAIHCTESTIDEFKSAIKLLRSLKASIKLVIAGNHDFTLDIPMFKREVAEVIPPLAPDLVRRENGDYEDARTLFDDPETKASGIFLLDEGTHQFALPNNALLKVYASPYTPSPGDWGFQYRPEAGHDFDIANNVDVVTTHGPPRGVMDTTYSGTRAGCPKLFAIVRLVRVVFY